MSALLIQIMNALLLKLVTEKFAGKLITHALEKVSKSTRNKVDDKIVKDVKDAFEEP